MVDPLLEQLLRSLITAGPVAVVLGVCLYVVWRDRNKSEEACAKERVAIQAAKDAEVKALQERVFAILEKLTKAMRGHNDD